MSRLTPVVSVALAAAALPLAAQAPADRAALRQFRDSLEIVTDSISLKALEGATIAIAKQHRDSALIHLRLGFIAMRLGELSGSSHFDDADGEFEWASELEPAWPFPWWGDGLAELAKGETSVIAIENIKQQLGLDHLSKAAKAFARAAALDPSFAQATIDLAEAALTQRIRPRLDVALHALRLAAATPVRNNPMFELVRGRVEREEGEADSALAAFRAYLAVGGDSGMGLLELARTNFWADRDAAGNREYYAGAAAARSDSALATYRRDISWIADSAELTAYDAVPSGPPRAEWLRRFWTKRDVADARALGERLAEHYRRWFYAMRSFRLVSPHRHYDFTAVYRSDQKEFDDRGIIYIRHGEPDLRAQYTATGGGEEVEPNESWLYRRPGGDLVFHFVSRGDVQDFKLVTGLVDALSFDERLRLQSTGDPGPDVRGLFASRANFGALYERVGDGVLTANVLKAVTDDRQRGRESIRIGTTTDDYSERFSEGLEPEVEEFVAGHSTGDSAALAGQDLHVVFAVPADRLEPVPAARGVLYPMRFRLYVTDARDSLVATLDTVRIFGAPAALRRPQFLTGLLEVPVPAGRLAYHLLVESVDGFTGAVVADDSVRADTLDGARFAASDLVVGRQGSGLMWRPPRDTVLLAPLDRFPQNSVAELYYEVYGVPRGRLVHTVVRVERLGGGSLFGWIGRLFGGGSRGMRIAFDAPSDGVASRVHHALDLRGLPAGDYRVTIALTDPATDRTVTRTRRITVTPAG